MILSNAQAATIQYGAPHSKTRWQRQPQPMMIRGVSPDMPGPHKFDEVFRIKSPRRDNGTDLILAVRRLNPIAVRLIAHRRIKCRHHNGMTRVHCSAGVRPPVHIISDTVLETAPVHRFYDWTHHVNEVTGSA